MKVSIIIPVYNTEQYVSRCIESCLGQTLPDVEIILIDDCSTDSSRNIIVSYAGKYPDKIRYIFQATNQRQGAARNRGMEIARGDYFLFVDSDDWIEPDTCERLYNKSVETGADMIGANAYYYSWDDRDKIIKLTLDKNMCGIMNKEKKARYVKNYGLFWTRMYKRRFLEACGLKFPENIFYEDALFNFYSVLYSDRIEHIDECFYHYYQENQSTVRNRNNPHQYERIRLAENIISFYETHSELSEYEQLIEYKYLSMQAENLIYTCLGQFDEPDKRIMKSISKAVSKKMGKLRKNRAYRSLSDEFRVFLLLNKVSPSICVFAYKHGIWYRIEAAMRRLKKRK